jgi:alpha-N-arabinofuranosidase
LLTDTDQGLVRTPTYYLWDMYRNHFGDQLLSIDVTTNSFDSKPVGAIASKWQVPYLDAVATRDSRGLIYLAVINRDLANSIFTTVTVDGLPFGMPVEALTLNGPSEISINGPSLTRTTQQGPINNVTTKATQWTSSDKPYSFPAHSITIMKWTPKGQPSRRK